MKTLKLSNTLVVIDVATNSLPEVYPCKLCDCQDYHPATPLPSKEPGQVYPWPLCSCGHIAQEH